MSGGNVLVVNAGSGSLKLDLLDDDDRRLASKVVESPPGSEDADRELDAFLSGASGVEAAGHRIVHGGPELTGPCLVDDGVRRQLDRAADLAPLHVPPALAALDTARRRLPDVAHVACFDTAFHAGLPEAARTYAVPKEWRERHGLRRYGFHGLSYAWALKQAGILLERPPAELHVVIAHLGGGGSVCAVAGGRSVSTSMGFTPLEGLVMVTRSGTVDPGMLLWLQTSRGMSAAELSDGLEHRSGLLGLSGGMSGDTRKLVSAAATGSQEATLAMDVYDLRVRECVAAAAASLDRLDALVFTGEIGSDQPEVRQAVSAGLGVLGLPPELDPRQDGDRVLSPAGSRVAVLLVHAREDLQIAGEVRQVLAGEGAS